MIGCSFSENAATLSGGGIANRSSGTKTLTNNGFCFNTPDQIDGAFADGGGNALQFCGPPIPSMPCPADFTGPGDAPDGMVGILEFLRVLADWGACP